MRHCVEIAYRNVLLRPLCREDLEYLRIWRNDPHNSLYLSRIPFITPDMQEKWFLKYLDNNDEMIFAVIETNKLGRIVGSLSLYEFRGKECLFGKILIGDINAHGQKVGENATIAAVKIAFDILNMTKVNLYVYPENAGALKVYKNAGFDIIDTHKDINGKDEYTMTILKEDTVKNAQHKQSPNA